jgi:hypothetical protein
MLAKDAEDCTSVVLAMMTPETAKARQVVSRLCSRLGEGPPDQNY